MTTLQQISVKWVERQHTLGLSGKKANSAAFEYMIGAAATLQAIEHSDADHVATGIALIRAYTPLPAARIARWATHGEIETPAA